MREWQKWLEPIRRKFKNVRGISLSTLELNRFLEIEYCIFLQQKVIPQQPCTDFYALVTGYMLEDVHQDDTVRTACMIARHRVRYLRTKTAWNRWLEWYVNQNEEWRLYDVDLIAGTVCQRPQPLFPERKHTYERQIQSSASLATLPRHTAKADHDYFFYVNNDRFSVKFPASFIPDTPPVLKKVKHRPKRKPIKIIWQELAKVADILTQRDPAGNWRQRFDALQFTLIKAGALEHQTESFAINRIFHLVGMVGAGKTTLITLLLYHLVVERKLHITIMVNTVVEAIQMADKLRQLDIAAAPVLGKARGTHRTKYGQVHAAYLMPEDIFQDEPHEEYSLNYLTGSCAISGLLRDGGPIPAGQEPCDTLEDHNDKRHQCPLRHQCGIYRAEQEFRTASVWIVNPASFIHSVVPQGSMDGEMRILEAVYRTSDLVIIDEADRVQVQWDRKFAPIEDLAGHQDALVDWIGLRILMELVQNSRRHISHWRHNELSMVAGEASRLSNWLIYLLRNHHDLVRWIGQQPLTNVTIYEALADQLSRKRPYAVQDETVREALMQAFRQFYTNPVSPEVGGEPAQLINDVRFQRPEIESDIANWLQNFLSWPLADHPEYERLVRRVLFGLVLTVMDSRVDTLLRNWLWAAHEFGEEKVIDHGPPDEYVDLIPESPIGNLLGYQYLESERDGVLKYIQCRGIGRWLLLNFPSLYQDLDGRTGPHLLLASATSWAPGSPQFHIDIAPHAILSPPAHELEAVKRSVFRYSPVPQQDGTHIRVSGIQGEERQANIDRIVRYLARSTANQPSQFERELRHWREQGQNRKILLLVGSYTEARRTAQTLQEIPSWHGRVLAMYADDDDSLDAWIIRRGEIETLGKRESDILVAPLLAIQRGFNILDALGGALLGTAYFLVRPYPMPNDVSQHVTGVNAWLTKQLDGNGRLPVQKPDASAAAVGDLRRRAFAQWQRRLQSGQHGLNGLPDDLYEELLWNQFVVVWQTIGRLVRRGREAHVYFMDAAFHPQKGRSMLRGWHDILDPYLGVQPTALTLEQQLAALLYGAPHNALMNMTNQLR